MAVQLPGGFIRPFVDEGTPLAPLSPQAAAQGIMHDYIGKLLAGQGQRVQLQNL